MAAGNITQTAGVVGENAGQLLVGGKTDAESQSTTRSRQIDAGLLDYVYAQTSKVLTGTLTAALILMVILWPIISHLQILTWTSCLIVLTMGRFALMKRYQAMPRQVDDLAAWRHRFIIGAGMGGALWGLGGVFFAQQSELLYQIFIIFILGGIATGAASVLPGVFPAFAATCLGTLFPILFWLFQHGDKMHIAMGASVALFMALVWMVARQMHDSLLDAFTLRYENSGLIEETTLVNRQLEMEVRQRGLTQDALDVIVRGTSASIGEDFFETLVHSLTEALGVKYALIGKLSDNSSSAITTLAIWADGKLSGNFDYDLADTPCGNVVGRKMCSYPKAVQEQFPEDVLLGEMGVESYVGAPLFDADENPMGLLAIMDTKPIRQVELAQSILSLFAARAATEMLRLSSEAERYRLATAVEQATDSIFIADENDIITYVNSAFEHITGYAGRDIAGKPASILHSSRQDESFYLDMRKTLLDQRAWTGKHFLRCSDGADIIVERNITYTTDRLNMLPSFISIFHDVTQEENTRKQMEHAQRLESLGVLTGGIAHDFNNILSAVLGNATLAATKLDATSPVKKHLSRIEDGTKRAAELCRQMLVYSGKGKIIPQPINLFTQVAEMSQLLEVSIAKSITIHYQLENDRHTFEADAAQIQQVIMNLIINASEAIGENSGDITIACGTAEIQAGQWDGQCYGDPLQAGRYAYLEVTDTGCGMDKETQARMFDPFFTTKLTGRGLGMSAVLGIVRSHKGAFFIDSTPGKGSTLKALFPCIEANVSLANIMNETECGNWRGSGTVLVIDDEESILDVASMMLSEMGFEVVTAADGEAGVEAFDTNRQDVVAVLLDMTMPIMDGLECLTRIRRISEDTRIILSSGYDEKDAAKSFNEHRLDGFIQKPYSPSQLRNTLMKALN